MKGSSNDNRRFRRARVDAPVYAAALLRFAAEAAAEAFAAACRPHRLDDRAVRSEVVRQLRRLSPPLRVLDADVSAGFGRAAGCRDVSRVASDTRVPDGVVRALGRGRVRLRPWP